MRPPYKALETQAKPAAVAVLSSLVPELCLERMYPRNSVARFSGRLDQAFAFQFRGQLFLGFALRFARDGAEKAAGRFLQSLDRPFRQRVAFLAPNSQPQGTCSASTFRRSRTIRVASITSLPTPSPGIHAILYFAIRYWPYSACWRPASAPDYDFAQAAAKRHSIELSRI